MNKSVRVGASTLSTKGNEGNSLVLGEECVCKCGRVSMGVQVCVHVEGGRGEQLAGAERRVAHYQEPGSQTKDFGPTWQAIGSHCRPWGN